MQYRIVPNGENSLIIDFGNRIDVKINDLVMKLAEQLERENFTGFIESVPAYSSLGVFYDLVSVKNAYPEHKTAFDAVSQLIEDSVKACKPGAKLKPRKIEIPVCYDAEFGPDLEFVAQASGLSVEEVIKIHAEGTYKVFMIGFLPGFAYMGEVDMRIATPRKQTPRAVVESGSLGIAGSQTGIYPLDSPGGWQIVGKTPLKLFRPEDEEISLLAPGDIVRFIPITKKDFDVLGR